VLVEDPEYSWLDLDFDCGGENALEQLVSAAVRYRIAVGPIAGLKTMTLRPQCHIRRLCASQDADRRT